MTVSWNIFGVILLLSFFRFQVVQAQTLRFTSLPTGPTSVEVGKNLTVYVRYEYTGRIGSKVEWLKGRDVLVRKLEDGRVITFQNRSRINGQASLVLASTTLMDNGTYTVRLTANDVGQSIDENVIVIIEERPNATTNCSKSHVINEGADLSCLCSAKDGSPPPTAAWFKDRTLIGDRRYGPVTLSLRNINKEQAGVYNCTAKSYSLEAFQLVNLTVNYKPEIISFEIVGKTTVVLGEDIKLRCKADSVPPSNYYIGLSGSNPEPVAGGLKEIRDISLNDTGTYICVAENSLGRVNKTLIVSEKGEPTSPSTVTTVTTKPTSRTTVRTPGENETSLGPGAVAGIVIGALFVVIVAIALVYCCCFKNPNAQGICGCTKKEDGGEGDHVVNHGVRPYVQPSRAENPYESVDGEKVNSEQETGPSGDTSPPPEGNSGGLPPVYAVVDKNKKTKKPPPKSQPASVTYASLDPVDLQPDSSKMRDRYREETNYADIDLGKLQSDLV